MRECARELSNLYVLARYVVPNHELRTRKFNSCGKSAAWAMLIHVLIIGCDEKEEGEH